VVDGCERRKGKRSLRMGMGRVRRSGVHADDGGLNPQSRRVEFLVC